MIVAPTGTGPDRSKVHQRGQVRKVAKCTFRTCPRWCSRRCSFIAVGSRGELDRRGELTGQRMGREGFDGLCYNSVDEQDTDGQPFRCCIESITHILSLVFFVGWHAGSMSYSTMLMVSLYPLYIDLYCFHTHHTSHTAKMPIIR